MSKEKHISFEEFAGNLAELMEKVRAEKSTIVVEYANGEMVLIKPYARTRPTSRKGAAPEADNSQQPAPKQPDNAENKSAMGAVFDIDPGSITPG